MQLRVSPEKICIVLGAQGLRCAPIAQYKSFLRFCQAHDHERLNEVLRAIATGGGTSADFQWINDVTLIAEGGVPQNPDEDLHRLHCAVHAGLQAVPPKVVKSHIAPAAPPQPPDRLSLHIDRNPPTPEESRREQRPKYKLYGSKSACTVELDETRSRHCTLMFEMAPGAGPRQYVWDKKIQFQITHRELPVLVAVLAGYAGHGYMCEFNAHGDANDKNLRLEDRGERLTLKINEGARFMAIKVAPTDIYHLLALAMKALKTNDPHLEGSTILEFCRRAYEPRRIPAK